MNENYLITIYQTTVERAENRRRPRKTQPGEILQREARIYLSLSAQAHFICNFIGKTIEVTVISHNCSVHLCSCSRP